MYSEIRDVEWKIGVLNDACSDVSNAAAYVNDFYYSIQKVRRLINESIKIDNKVFCSEMMDQATTTTSSAYSALRTSIPQSMYSELRGLRKYLNYLYELLRREEEEDDD